MSTSGLGDPDAHRIDGKVSGIVEPVLWLDGKNRAMLICDP